MGLCLSLDDDEKEAKIVSQHIDKQINKESYAQNAVYKILLLGAAECGKSTLVKQMKIIHNDGFSLEECLAYRCTILDNVLQSMKYVLNGMGFLRINLENMHNKVHAQTVLSCHSAYDERHAMLPFLGHALSGLWADGGVRRCVSCGHLYELNDSALYYFSNLERLSSPNYIPNSTDVVRARIRTNGVIETNFRVDNLNIRMIDVGGQRSERRKWIQCFEDVGAVLFVASLSDYDMTLMEDPSQNRLQESLQLFSSICNNRFFVRTALILFLNKLDLFERKIMYSGRHLSYYMSDFKGEDCQVEIAAKHIQHKFQCVNRNPGKVVYTHFTTATDTYNIQVVFQVAIDTIVRENLRNASLL